MASVIYGKCYLWQMYYGKCNYGKNIYGKNIMANETEPFILMSKIRITYVNPEHFNVEAYKVYFKELRNLKRNRK